MRRACKSHVPGPGSEHIEAGERERRKIIARRWRRRGVPVGEATEDERRQFERLLAKWKAPQPAGEEAP